MQKEDCTSCIIDGHSYATRTFSLSLFSSLPRVRRMQTCRCLPSSLPLSLSLSLSLSHTHTLFVVRRVFYPFLASLASSTPSFAVQSSYNIYRAPAYGGRCLPCLLTYFRWMWCANSRQRFGSDHFRFAAVHSAQNLGFQFVIVRRCRRR